MPKYGSPTVSRRALLGLGIAGAGVIVATSLPAGAAFGATAGQSSAQPRLDGFTDLVGLQAEYAAALAQSSLPLPAGRSLPESFDVSKLDASAVWQVGIGRAALFTAWQREVTLAARDAYASGDQVAGSGALDLLEKGYLSAEKKALTGRGDDQFVQRVIQPARAANMSARRATNQDLTRLMDAAFAA